VLVEPSLVWLVCGLGPSAAYALLALQADRKAGGMNKSSLARVGDYVFIPIWLGALLWTSRGAELIAFAFAGTLFAQRVNQILKKLVRRPRPPKAWAQRFAYRGYWTDVRGWSVNEGSEEGGAAESVGSMPADAESFPSGDAAQADALFERGGESEFQGLTPQQLVDLAARGNRMQALFGAANREREVLREVSTQTVCPLRKKTKVKVCPLLVICGPILINCLCLQLSALKESIMRRIEQIAREDRDVTKLQSELVEQRREAIAHAEAITRMRQQAEVRRSFTLSPRVFP
jgi:hypothetical protein